MARRSYAGGAQPTTLASSVNSTTTVISAVALVGWPIPTHPFFAVIDRETPSEEKVLCQSVNGNDITVLRGQDGTTARDHSAGAKFEHCHTATDADEANAHANSTSAHGAPVGDGFVFRDAAQTLKNKTLDFGVTGANQATNIPRAASPEIDTAITNETAARVAGDQANAAALAAHEAAADPHPQYLTQPEGAALISAALPAGSITMWAGASPPSGWLLCDGSTVSRGAYPALFAVLQETYGAGDGSTTFGLPNFNGRVPRGTGSNGTNGVSGSPTVYARNGSGGLDSRAVTAANLPPHAHTINHDHGAFTTASGGSHTHRIDLDEHTTDTTHVHEGLTAASAAPGGGGTTQPARDGIVGSTDSPHTHSIDVPNFTGNSGNGPGTSTPVDTRDPFRAIPFIIKAV